MKKQLSKWYAWLIHHWVGIAICSILVIIVSGKHQYYSGMLIGGILLCTILTLSVIDDDHWDRGTVQMLAYSFIEVDHTLRDYEIVSLLEAYGISISVLKLRKCMKRLIRKKRVALSKSQDFYTYEMVYELA